MSFDDDLRRARLIHRLRVALGEAEQPYASQAAHDELWRTLRMWWAHRELEAHALADVWDDKAHAFAAVRELRTRLRTRCVAEDA